MTDSNHLLVELLHEIKDDVKEVRDDLNNVRNELAQHIKDEMTLFQGHDNSHIFLSALMEREAKRVKFRDAVIEHSLSSLVWSMLVATALGIWAYLKDHFKWQS